MSLGPARRKFGKLVLILLSVLGFGMIVVSVTQWMFHIETIQVMGDNIRVVVDEERIARNLLFFPSAATRQAVLKDNPWLADVAIQKQFPHTLRIVPVLRTPMVILVSDMQTVLLDGEGMVLAHGDMGHNLPRIFVHLPSVRVGQSVENSAVAHALEFIHKTNDMFVIRTITDYDNAYLLVKTEQSDIFIPHDRPVAGSIATLQTLISGFRIKGTLPNVVDLRFDKPIVKY